MVARNRIVLGGTVADGQEIWSTSVAFGGAPVVSDPTELQAWADGIALFLGTELIDTGALAGLSQLLSDSGAVTSVSVYHYPAAGPSDAAGMATLNAGGEGSVRCPVQTSVVLSLRTAIPGSRFRGRMYWPAQGAQVTSEGRLGGTLTVSAIATQASALLEAIAAASPGAPSVFPAVHSGVADVITPVTQIAVGNVPDTQRRRRNGLAETYTVVDYAG